MAIASHIVITIEATASPSITYHKKFAILLILMFFLSFPTVFYSTRQIY